MSDNALLKLLEQNASLSPEMLSKALKTSVKEVKDAIKRLEKKKVIMAYKAIINPEKLKTPNSVTAMIEVRITPERDGGFDRLALRISCYSEVISCHLMSGGHDLTVIVKGKNLKDVSMFVSQKLSTLPGILSTATHFMLRSYKEQGIIMTQEEKAERLKISP